MNIETKPSAKLSFTMMDRPEHDATLLKLRGPIDSFSYLALKAVLKRLAEGELEIKRRHLLVDFQEVSYCASSGWSVLFLQTSLLKEQKRALVLFNVGERTSHSLGMLANKEQLIKVACDEASAIKALAV